MKGTVLQLLYHVRELDMLLRRRDKHRGNANVNHLNFVTSGRTLTRMVGLTVWVSMSLASESSGHFYFIESCFKVYYSGPGPRTPTSWTRALGRSPPTPTSTPSPDTSWTDTVSPYYSHQRYT